MGTTQSHRKTVYYVTTVKQPFLQLAASPELSVTKKHIDQCNREALDALYLEIEMDRPNIVLLDDTGQQAYTLASRAIPRAFTKERRVYVVLSSDKDSAKRRELYGDIGIHQFLFKDQADAQHVLEELPVC